MTELRALDEHQLSTLESAVPALSGPERTGELVYGTDLVDHHCHVTSVEDLARLANWGIGTVVNMAGSPFHRSLATAARGRPGLAALENVSPLLDSVPPGGAPFRGLAINVQDAAAAVDTVRMMADIGYRAVKTYTHLSESAYTAVAATARDVGLQVVGHIPASVAHAAAIDAGQHRFEHLSNMVAELADPEVYRTATGRPDFATSTAPMEAILGSVDWSAAAGIADRMAAAGAAVCPTLLIHVPYADRPRRQQAVGPRVEKSWTAFADDYPWRQLLLDFYLDLTSLLARHGVRVLAGTDAPDPYTYPGSSLFDELGLLQDAGLAEHDVWAAASRPDGPSRAESRTSGPGVVVRRPDRPGAASVLAILDADGRFRPPPSGYSGGPDDLVLGSGVGEWAAIRDAALRDLDLDWAAVFDEVTLPRPAGLRIGFGGGAGELVLVEEEVSADGVCLRVIRSRGGRLVLLRHWFRTTAEQLMFSNEYTVDRPGTVRSRGYGLADRTLPIVPGADPLEVACGGLSVLHPALAAASSGRTTLRGLWGAYPDHELAHSIPLVVTAGGSQVSVVSLLLGGYRQTVTLDGAGRPYGIAMRSAEFTCDWRRVRERYGAAARRLLRDGGPADTD